MTTGATPTRNSKRLPGLTGGVDFDRPVKFLWLQGLIDRSIRREIQKIVERYDLSVPEFTTLVVLQSVPGLSNAELARRSLVTPQSMNTVVARLHERGLVERRQDPTHGRILLTEITEAGSIHLAEPRREVIALEAELLDGFTDDELDQTKHVLATLLSRLLVRSHDD